MSIWQVVAREKTLAPTDTIYGAYYKRKLMRCKSGNKI